MMVTILFNELHQGDPMKFLVPMLFAFSLTAAAQTTAPATKPMPAAATYKVDQKATTVKWVGKKVTGEHAGTVAVKDGTLVYTGDVITGGDITVDMKSLTVTDIPATDENNAKLVGHLTSKDFFDVEKHPEAKLVITGSEKSKTGLKIKGNLTMIGQTNPVEFDAKVSKTDSTVTAKSDIEIDRTKWKLIYGSGDFIKGLGDKAINNKFILSVDVTAKK